MSNRHGEPADDTEETPAPRPSVRKVTVRNYVDEKKLAADSTYSLANLSDAMMEQASLLVHYGVQSSRASRQVDDLKMLLEVTEAKVYRRIRDEVAAKGEKVTEAQLEKLVATHPQVIEVKKALNEAKQIEANAKIAVEAFRHRKDMLVSQGLLAREELKGEVSINRRKEAEAETAATVDRLIKQMAADAGKTH